MPELNEALSEREIEVLELVSEGATTKEIAPKLFISPNTVKVHLRNINRKLGAQSRTEAVRIAIERGIISIGTNGTHTDADLNPVTTAPPLTAEPGLDLAEFPANMELTGDTTVQPPSLPGSATEISEKSTPAGTGEIEQKTTNRLFIIGGLVILTALIGIIGYLVLTRTGPNVTAPDDAPASLFESQQIEDSSWFTNPSLLRPTSDMIVVSIGTDIYAVGGLAEDGSVLSDVLIYSTQDKRWQSGQNKPTPVFGAAGAELLGLIYALGGNVDSGEPTAVAEVYSPSEDQWGQVEPLPEPLANGFAVTEGGAIYHFGGQGIDGIVDKTYIFDPSSNLWRSSTPMPEARAGAAGGVLNGNIYVIGGFDESGSPTNSCFIFLTETEAWETCPAPSASRANAGAVVLLNKLYLLGGTSSSTSGEQFDPETGDWTIIRQPMVSSSNPNWYGVGVANVERKIYTLGGIMGETTIAETYAYTPQLFTVFIPSAGNQDGE